MRYDQKEFERIRSRHGDCASWAIWGDPSSDEVRSGMGDLSIFDANNGSHFVGKHLHADYIFVALNFSVDVRTISPPWQSWANFHSSSPRTRDYRLRQAIAGTAAVGGYMTDIIKNHHELTAANVLRTLRKNPQIIEQNIAKFDQEMIDIKSNPNSIILCLGLAVHGILCKYLKSGHEIRYIPHYSNRTIDNNEYKNRVWNAINGGTESISVAAAYT